MSVPTWKRSMSAAEYVYQSFLLNKEIARICNKLPKKYRTNYSDELIKEGMEVMKHLQIANTIYLKGKESYNKRKEHLYEAVGILQNISTISYIYFEMVRHNCEEPDEWIYKAENNIGELCYKVISLTRGIIRSDRERYNKSFKNKS